MVDSIFETDKDYYPQPFLEKCKYFVKQEQLKMYIIDEIETLPDEFDKSDTSDKKMM